VSITRAKSIDSLYEECKDFDLVLVPDAPMASALNRRLDQPHFGPFAITPRRLAARRREQAEDRLAFLEIIETTDLNWKETSYAVGNILQCWEYQGTADAVLDYEQFATAATHTAVDCIAEMDTTSTRLTEYCIEADTSVAVVGFKQLTELERSILPQTTDDRSVHRGVIRSSILPHSRLAGRNRRRGPRCGHTGERRRRGCRPRCSQSVFTTH